MLNTIQLKRIWVLKDFVLFARDTTIISDRTVVQDGFAGAYGYVSLGCDVILYSDLRSRASYFSDNFILSFK